MKVLVIGATGRAGRRLVEYSLEKGHEVTAFARNIDQLTLKHENLHKVQGDVQYQGLVDAAMPGHDIVLSVIGVRQFQGPISILSTGMKHIIRSMEKHAIQRIVTITGAGILQETDGLLIMESLSFPPNLQNLSLDHLRMWKYLKASKLNYTVVCPAFMHFGKRSGKYLVKADHYPSPAQNEISVEDVADFITDEMIQNEYLRRRVGIARPL